MAIVRRVVPVIAVILSLSAISASAQSDWSFNDVANVTPPDGCAAQATMTGLGFDPQNRAVAGWQTSWSCGGNGEIHWGRLDEGTWTKHQITDPTTHHAPKGLPADLILRADGAPFYAYASVGSAYIFGNFGWWQVTLADLNANPTSSVDRRRLIQYYQDCTSAYPNFALAFSPGQNAPNILTGTRCSYSGWLTLDTNSETEPIGTLHGSPIFGAVAGTGGEFIDTDYATGPTGSHHVVYSYERGGPDWGVGYNNGTPGHEVKLAVPHRNRGAEVSIAVDAAGRIHVAIGGIPTCDNTFEGGLLYATSDDGVTWDKTFVDTVSARHPSITIDSEGRPNISYSRYGTDVRLARRTYDGWTTEHVMTAEGSEQASSTRLAFDLEQHPNVLLYDNSPRKIVLATGSVTGPSLSLASPGDLAGVLGGTVSLMLTASGQEGDVTFDATCLPAGVSIDPQTGAVTGTLPASPGESRPTITVTDGDDNTAVINFTWTWDVPPPNSAPVASDGSATTNEDTPVEITLAATDADDDTLTFVITGDPQHGSVTVDGNVATYTPAQDEHGSDSFTFQATDGTATSATATIQLDVVPVNDPPQLTAVTGQTVTEGETITFTLIASDPDVDEVLSFSASDLPAGATLDETTGVFFWTTSAAQSGSHTITFHVTDNDSLSASQQATMIVLEPPPALDCSAARPSVTELWTANHKKETIEILDVVGAVNVVVTAIRQDEPTDSSGNRSTSIDGGGVGTSQPWVRAERLTAPGKRGNGRIYEIHFTATDSNSEVCTGQLIVGVPRWRGKASVDDLFRYDSTVAGGPLLP